LGDEGFRFEIFSKNHRLPDLLETRHFKVGDVEVLEGRGSVLEGIGGSGGEGMGLEEVGEIGGDGLSA
jgi:hypothetical protein